MKHPARKSHYLGGRRIDPRPLTGREPVWQTIDQAFTSYNAGRLREGCQLLVEKMLRPDVTVGLSLTGALTPAGYGKSCLVPLIASGFVDWIISTGANLYHDTHHAIGLALHAGSPLADDVALREAGVVRIYDIVFDYHVLLDTDRFYRQVMRLPEFTARCRLRNSTIGWAATWPRSKTASASPAPRCSPRPTASTCRSSPPRPGTARSA